MESSNRAETQTRRKAFFLPTPAGERFCLVTEAAGEPKGSLLYIHPFAEEMNKSRRMAALGARAFASAGWTTFQIDLGGCGDSAGDFGDASWTGWLDDVTSAAEQIRCMRPHSPLVLWTLRAGCLLAADWVERRGEDLPLLLWQPIASGRQHLTQFLRLKAASEMLTASQTAGVLGKLRAELDAGRPVEVAGYQISSRLATGLGSSEFRLPPSYASAIAICEIVGPQQTGVSPATQVLTRRLQEAGLAVQAQHVHGPSFWQTVEIETAPELIDASLDCIGEVEA